MGKANAITPSPQLERFILNAKEKVACIGSKGLLLMVLLTLFAQGAAYNGIDGYISNHIANNTVIMKYDLRVSITYNGSASVETDENQYEMDFKTVYAINNKVSSCTQFGKPQDICIALSIYN